MIRRPSWPIAPRGSLDFSASTHKVDCGSGASIDDQQTLTTITWAWVDTLTDARIWTKGYLAAHSTFHYFGIGAVAFTCEYDRATTDQTVSAAPANFAYWGTGRWLCLVTQSDPSTSSANKLLVGNLTNPPAAPSAYVTQQAGSGAFTSDAAASLVLGQIGNNGQPLDGKLQAMWWVNRLLTMTEIVQVWDHSRRGQLVYPIPGMVLCLPLGANGLSLQRDYSGFANHGTVTGATLAVPAPFRSVTRPLWMKKVAAAGGRIFKLAGDGGGLAGPSRGLAASGWRKLKHLWFPPKGGWTPPEQRV